MVEATQNAADLKEQLEELTDGNKIGKKVERAYNNLRDRAISGTWKSMWEMAGSGAGKGIIAVAAATVAAFAFVGAATAISHMLMMKDYSPVSVLNGALGGTAAGASFLAGWSPPMAGLGAGFASHAWGLGVLGVGAAAGAFLEQSKESEDLAAARERAALRAAGKTPVADVTQHPMYDVEIDSRGPATGIAPAAPAPVSQTPSSPAGNAAQPSETPASPTPAAPAPASPSNDKSTAAPPQAAAGTYVSYVEPRQPVAAPPAQPGNANGDFIHVVTTADIPAGLDTGTPDALLSAAQFVQTIEARQGMKIACLEEIAWRRDFIDNAQLTRLAEGYGQSDYGHYLRGVVENP